MDDLTASPLLLATEHSDQDAGAEAVAMALARRRGVPLAAVLPLARSAELEMEAPEASARADEQAARRREALLALARAAGVQVDLHLRRGPELHSEILDEASERRAGLLVIRRRGYRGLLANLLVGEMVNRVIAQAPCSVLVVPRDSRLWQRAVLACIDPQRRDPSLPAAAASMARTSGAALHLVCVAPDAARQAQAQQALAMAIADSGEPAARGEVRVGDAPAEIIAAAKACAADLLAVGRGAAPAGRTAARGRLGSVAHAVTGLAACPVLLHMPAAAAQPPKGP